MNYVIGIDVGSSDCKAVILDQRGNIAASAVQSYPTRYPRPGWAEQNAEDWYRSACQAVRACMESSVIAPGDVVGIAVDGPAHNVALMDYGGALIYPVIHWSDLRSTPQAERLEAQCGQRIFDLTYSRVNPSWTLTQLLWLKENEPAVWARLRQILVTKDYVQYRLTGLYQTDAYDAIGTQLYEVAADRWSAELCDLLGFDPAWLPPVKPPMTIGGYLNRNAAEAMGLLKGTSVAVGSGDSVVEAFSIGAVKPGQCIVKLGTAANVNLVTARPMPSLQTITYRHVTGDAWFTITPTNSGASTMRWFRDTFCRHEVETATSQGITVWQLIDQLAAGAPAGANGLLFHPYLMGERAPHWDPHLRGDFVGITARHSLHHFARAILEGVAFSIRDCLSVVQGLGEPVTDLYLIGGGAKSQLWRQTLADVIGLPLIKPAIEDAALGSAMVAGVALGMFANVESAIATCARTEQVLQPNEALRQRYNDYFEVYRAVTADLVRHSHRLAALANEGE